MQQSLATLALWTFDFDLNPKLVKENYATIGLEI